MGGREVARGGGYARAAHNHAICSPLRSPYPLPMRSGRPAPACRSASPYILFLFPPHIGAPLPAWLPSGIEKLAEKPSKQVAWDMMRDLSKWIEKVWGGAVGDTDEGGGLG